MAIFKGAGVAIVTPMKEDGSVNFEKLQEIIDFQIANNTDSAAAIIEANKHKGFAVIDILQPCVTFNKICTHAMFLQNTYYLGDDYDPTNKKEAFEKAHEFGEKRIPVGIFYKEEKPTLEEGYSQISEIPLVDQDPKFNGLTDLFKKYT